MKLAAARPLIAALMIVMALAAGCSRNKHVIEFDPNFSYNIVKAPSWFPGKEETLTPAQSDVLFRRGRPDAIRFWWRSDGSFITSSDLTGQEPDKIGEQITTMDRSWIYLRDKQEVIFSRNGRSYDVKPLDPLVELVATYGDPSSRSQPHIIDGEKHETWQWIEYGLQVEIVDGKIVSRSYFPATGKGTWGLK